MVRLQFLQGSNTPGKLSFQPDNISDPGTHGKLSFCQCCCDHLQLIPFWFHFIPVDNMCGDFTLSVGLSGEWTWNIGGNNCDDWDIATPSAVGDIRCFDPSFEGVGDPEAEVDLNVRMYCTEIDKFRADVCFSTTNTDPEFNSTDCDQGFLLGLLGTQTSGLDICDIAHEYDEDPGYIAGTNPFVLDFGEIQPVICGDGCDFRLVANDVSTPPVLSMLPPGMPATSGGQNPLPVGVRQWLESDNI